MKLRIIGDAIVSDEGDVIARFDPQLLATRRDVAETLLFLPAQETDWDLQMRVYEQQDRIAELEAEIERLKSGSPVGATGPNESGSPQ